MASSPAPMIVAALVSKARREITAHFMQLHAVTPGDAVAFVPDKLIVRRQFDKLVARGVIKQAGKDLYWLDTAAYNNDIEARRRKLVPVVIVVFVVLAAVLTLAYQG